MSPSHANNKYRSWGGRAPALFAHPAARKAWSPRPPAAALPAARPGPCRGGRLGRREPCHPPRALRALPASRGLRVCQTARPLRPDLATRSCISACVRASAAGWSRPYQIYAERPSRPRNAYVEWGRPSVLRDVTVADSKASIS